MKRFRFAMLPVMLLVAVGFVLLCAVSLAVTSVPVMAEAVAVALPPAEGEAWTLLDWYMLVASIAGTCAWIAALTPTKRDDRWVGYLLRIVDIIGANLNSDNVQRRR